MSESSDYSPGQWAGHNFTAARQQYDKDAGRGAAKAAANNVKQSDLVPDTLTSTSTHPVRIDIDFTGSMGGWPGVIVGKLPYLDHEMRTEYLSEEAEVSFGAFCDTADTYTLQIQPFTKGTEMKTSLENLLHVGGGGGSDHMCEAHGVPALYSARNVQMPNAIIKPIYIFITDEMPHHSVVKSSAKNFAKVDIERAMSREEIFEELMEMYSVYVVLKPYGYGTLDKDHMDSDTTTVYNCWKQLIGSDRIALLPDADRVVDVIFGILAKEVGREDYFKKELTGRQTKKQVDTVYKSLQTVHALPKSTGGNSPKTSKLLGKGKSTLHKPTGGGKKSGNLV